MSWVDCVIDNDYEIFTEYPYQIRKKSNERIVKVAPHPTTGYLRVRLNGKSYMKHRIIALQFIENDDPENKTEIDHINHNRTDFHIENLRWVSHSENNKNRTSTKGYQYIYMDELPETAEPLDSYNGHDLDGVYIDYEEQKLYLFNGVRYRELIPCRIRGNIRYCVHDIENKSVDLRHKVLFG